MSDADAARWKKLSALFDEALKRPSDDRDRYLQAECGGDSEFLEQARALIAAADKEDTELRELIADGAVEAIGWAGAGPQPQRIGNYDLVRLLGAGGMGTVYLARRADDRFDHEVAIKLLKPGVTHPHFVERFKAERQVLAGLEHPNISRLLDGGETADGRPYLVMEYVRGEAIDVYCDQRRLGIDDRLRLFQQICLALDYAHRNLVVHRDVKRSNILVTDEGVPKLLDFGIAKVLADGHMLTLTVEGERLMTPECASPEQVRGEPVSTATDVYSLGVLLYRLLCGRGPYAVRSDLPSSLAQAILQDEPSKPSAAVVTGGDDPDAVTGEAISDHRGSTMPRLRRRLKGDLDNIALKALRKEPERRYASARALHEDIDNYLANRPISARPDAFAYRTGKFVRRHRAMVAIACAFVLLAVFSVAQIIEQRNRAEAQAATAERISSFLVSMLESANPYERSEAVTARDLLDRGAKQIDEELADQPVVGGRLRTTMAKAYSSLGFQETASELATRAVETFSGRQGGRDLAVAVATLADIEYQKQKYASSLALYREAIGYFEATADNDTRAQIARTRIGLSKTLLRLDKSSEMLVAGRQALDELRALFGDDHADTNAAVANLSFLHNAIGDYDRAKVYAEAVVRWLETTYGSSDLMLAAPLHNLGRITWHQGDYRGAHAIYVRELAILEAGLGEHHPALHPVLVSLASNQRKLGYENTAKAYYERAIQVLENSESPPLGRLADTYGALGTLIMDAGFLDEAEPLIRRALDLSQKVHGVGNADNSFRLLHLGILFRKREMFDEARRYLQQAVDATLNRYRGTHRSVLIMRMHLGVNEALAGETTLAFEILEDTLAKLETHHGPEHPLVGQILLELSEVDVMVKRFARADQRLVRSLKIYRALRDKWHPDIELALRVRAKAQRGMGHDGRAIELLAEADALHAGRQKVSAEEAKKTQQKRF